MSRLLRALGAAASAVGAALLTLAVWPPPHPVSDPGAATVVRVVDGDTLVAEVGTGTETVRLIGIDTPESVAPHRAVECYGHEAATRLAALAAPGHAGAADPRRRGPRPLRPAAGLRRAGR